MKKTLIALMALAGVAAATELSDAVITMGSKESITLQSTDSLYHDSSVSMTMNLDLDALKTALSTSGVDKRNYLLGSFAIDVNSTNHNGYAGALVIYTSSSASTTSSSVWISADGSKGKENVSGSSATYLSNLLTSDSWTNATGAALTLTVNVTASATTAKTVAYLTLTDSEGNLTQYSNSTDAIRWSSFDSTYGITSISTGELTKKAYIFNEAVTADTALALNKAALTPEPATATLSLLALAGLCARRRR